MISAVGLTLMGSICNETAEHTYMCSLEQLEREENMQSQYTILKPIEYGWQYKIGTLLVPVPKGQEPHAFYRKMQELVLGIKWSKYSG